MLALLLALATASLPAPGPAAPPAQEPGEANAAARALPPQLAAAVEAALATTAGRAEVLAVEGTLPAACALARAEVPRPVTASGRVAARLTGPAGAPGTCDRWAWLRVRVTAPALVTTRELADGASLEGAVRLEEREVTPGRAWLTHLPEGATAARALPANTALDDALLRLGPRPGGQVAIVMRAGALSVEREGRAVPCRRGRACALLPSGKRLEGTWHGGRIEVESP